METSGPVTGRAFGPLRGLAWGREVPRPPARRPLTRYALPVAVLPILLLGLITAVNLGNGGRVHPELAAAIGAGTAIPVVVAWRRPVLAWRLAFPMLWVAAIWTPLAMVWPWSVPQSLCYLVVLGRLAVVGSDSWQTYWATALSIAATFTFVRVDDGLVVGVLLVALAAIGDIFARRRRTGDLLAEQSELNELERARWAILEERTRIAREMHDVVAHHMSMIAVRAETAPFRMPGMAPEAQAELATIAAAAREALSDMRLLLGVLRSEREERQTAPQPGLADVDALVDKARAAGLTVEVHVEHLGSVPPTVGLAAYRIVQEALANAARHAPPGAPVSLAARARPGELEISIGNPLPDPPATDPPATGAAGHGLAGMRERATLLGGTLSAGPRDGQFVVRAVLPVAEEDASHDQAADRR